MRSKTMTRLFLDIGGVLLTDGWDHHARRPGNEGPAPASSSGSACCCCLRR